MVYPVAATFGWLCVETMQGQQGMAGALAATFGWLCVETFGKATLRRKGIQAATFGWLCVETCAGVCVWAV